MNFDEKLREFYESRMKNGIYDKTCECFSDGTKMDNWFKKKEVRNIIFSSDDSMCIEIKEAYAKYLISVKRNPNRDFTESIKVTKVKNKMYQEFVDYESLSKFEMNSDAKFLSGLSMSKWFFEYKNYILQSKNKLCVEIQQQYEKYLEQKRELYIKKQKLLYEKNKCIFYKESDINKFDSSGNVKFPDGTFMGEWFKKYKKVILLSDGLIEKEIQKSYELYLSVYELKKEFLKEENLDKFDEFGYVKFSSGALMNFYWEVYKDSILNSYCDIDKLIKKQYYEYKISNGEFQGNKILKKV